MRENISVQLQKIQRTMEQVSGRSVLVVKANYNSILSRFGEVINTLKPTLMASPNELMRTILGISIGDNSGKCLESCSTHWSV